MRKIVIFFLALIFSSFFVFAEYNNFGVPDSSEIRKNLIETWFLAPLSNVRMNRPEIYKNSIGQQFQVRMEEANKEFYIFVSPFSQMKVDVISDKGKSTVMQETYPGDAPGSFVLIRDKKTGKPLKIRYYFASDSEIYVQFSEFKNMAVADFIFYNCYASRFVPTGLPFARFYSASFADIQSWTKNVIHWEYTKIYKDNYYAILQMINIIREELPNLVITEDAMYDENLNPVNISDGKLRKIKTGDEDKITLSGAGFLKWIGDGITAPLNGAYLKREPLLLETVSYKDVGYQGILANQYSISFSLDWIRNLASAIVSIRSGKKYLYDESGVDVDLEPFSQEFTEKGFVNSTGYIKNTGYSCKTLKSLLYVLCAIEPETFYFAAIRETDRRKNPEVKLFSQCAVFFPYFDNDGHFRCAIFKDCQEMSIEDFCSRYYNDYIFLTRCNATDRFSPETVEKK